MRIKRFDEEDEEDMACVVPSLLPSEEALPELGTVINLPNYESFIPSECSSLLLYEREREREREAQATSAAREWQLRGIERESSSRLVRHSFALIPGTQHCSTLSSANRSPHGDCPTFILQKKCQCTSWKTFT
jgi:hypothetical protein